ncbi:MAG: hypothetical protein ACKV22_34160 [Bryobacteraceae bacterium]
MSKAGVLIVNSYCPVGQAKLGYRTGYYADKLFAEFNSTDKERQLEDALGDPVSELPLAVETITSGRAPIVIYFERRRRTPKEHDSPSRLPALPDLPRRGLVARWNGNSRRRRTGTAPV